MVWCWCVCVCVCKTRKRNATYFSKSGWCGAGGVRVCVKLASAMQPISVSLAGVVLGDVRVCVKLASAMQPISAAKGLAQLSVAWSQDF